MNQTTIRSLGIAAGIAVSFAFITSTTLAQGQGQGRPGGRPMGGPPVEQNRPPQVEGRFTDGPMGGRGDQRPMAQRPLPHQEYMSVIWMLRDDEAPSILRLSKEQEQKITEIDEKFRAAMSEHMLQMRDVARGDRDRGPQGQRGPGSRPAAEGEDPPTRPARPQQRPATTPSDDQQQPGPRRITDAERERIEALRQNMPRPAEAQTQIWAQLNDVQQEFVQDEVAERQRIAEQRRDEDMMRRRAQFRERMEGDGAEGRGQWRGERGSPEAQAQRQRLGRAMQQLQQLPPEERERIFAVLEQELEKAALTYPPRERTAEETADRQRRIQRWRTMNRNGDGEEEGQRPARRQRPQEGPR